MVKSQRIALVLLVLIVFCTIQGCTRNQTTSATTTLHVLDLTPTEQPTLAPTNTSTHISFTTPTATPRILVLTPTEQPTLAPTKITTHTSIITPTPTITLTPVPPGVFLLLSYTPLTMNYDTSAWVDESRYTDPNRMVNYLQASGFVTCTLGVIGPSGNYPTPSEIVYLGKVRYQVTTYEHLLPGKIYALYIEDNSLVGYDYEKGLPVLGIEASSSEWSKCKKLAEKVLSTLHSPSD